MTSSTSDEPAVLVEHAATGVTRIIFNRPNQRNAMNRAARAGIVRALDECRGSARVVLLSGAGSAFCAGMDLKETGASTGDPELDRRSEWDMVQEELRRHPAVIISAVNGFALGGGLTLVNTSDLAIAAEDATFGLPEMGFGAYPVYAGPTTQLRVSQKRASWLVLTAERISAATALDWGLINRVVPLEDLEREAVALAERIAGFSAPALEVGKRMLWTIPSEISEWSAAVALGVSTMDTIRASNGNPDAGMQRFRQGLRSPGQGR
jgi:enoyl-CoA hydratase/carnithine racemase